jgi:hypothetical protein
MEVSATGGYKPKARFKKFRNVPEMLRMFRMPTDVQTAEDLKLPTPKVANGGRPIDIVVPKTDAFDEWQAERLQQLAEDDSKAAMLTYINDARKAALDLRMVGRDGYTGKIDKAADQIAQVYHANKDQRFYIDRKRPELGYQDTPGALQIVFADFGTPGSEGWNAYDAIRDEVARRGVPREKVKFIHEAKNDEQRAEMFQAARDGRIAVLFGSTQKMGVGTNVQDRAVALHHIDSQWRPADIHQREGRLVRQGNQHRELGKEVSIYRYLTEGSVDAYMWQTGKTKSDFIGQVMRGSLSQREVEDLGEVSASFAVAAALASGNPHLLEKAKVDDELKRLTRLDKKFRRDQGLLSGRIDAWKVQKYQAEQNAAKLGEAIKKRKDVSGEKFRMTVNGAGFSKRAEAGEALRGQLASALGEWYHGPEGKRRVVGQFGGFDVVATPINQQGTQKKVRVELDGVPLSAFELGGDDLKEGNTLGTVTRLENRLTAMEGSKTQLERAAATYSRDLEAAQKKVGADNPYRDRLDRMSRRATVLGEFMELDNREGQRSPEDREKLADLGGELDGLRAQDPDISTVDLGPGPSDGDAPRMELDEGDISVSLDPSEVERDLTALGADTADLPDGDQGEFDLPIHDAEGAVVDDSPDVPDSPDVADVPDPEVAVPGDGDTAAAPETSDAPDTPDPEIQVPGDGDTADVPDSTDVPDTTEDPATPDAPQTADTPDPLRERLDAIARERAATGTPEATDTPDTPDTSDAPAAPAGHPNPPSAAELMAMTRNAPRDEALDQMSREQLTQLFRDITAEERRLAPNGRGSKPQLRGTWTRADRLRTAIGQRLNALSGHADRPRPAFTDRAVLDALQGEVLDTRELAEHFGVPQPRMLTALRRLEADGWVDRNLGMDGADAFGANGETSGGRRNMNALTWETTEGRDGDHAALMARYDAAHPPVEPSNIGSTEPLSEDNPDRAAALAREAEDRYRGARADAARNVSRGHGGQAARDIRDGVDPNAPDNPDTPDTPDTPDVAKREYASGMTPVEAPPTDPQVVEAVDGPPVDATPDSDPDAMSTEALEAEATGVIRREPETLEGEKYPPTRQQQDVIDHVLAKKDVVVTAKAGTGKTSTLEALARRLQAEEPGTRALYIAFNSSVQAEAEGRMPDNVESRTGHSLGVVWAGRGLSKRLDDKDAKALKPDQAARILGIKPLSLGGGDELTPAEQMMAATRTVDAYATSADDEIGPQHLPESVTKLPQAAQDAVLAHAQRVWEDVQRPDGKMKMTYDYLRKQWALSRPDLTKDGAGQRKGGAHILFLDEAQDTPPVLAKVVEDQKMRKVIVGDADQAIYGFTGAKDYLSSAPRDVQLPLNQSWRFGPEVADVGNRFLQLLDSPDRVIGGGAPSVVHRDAPMENADAILTRSNGGMIGEILREQGSGRLVGVPKGTKGDLFSLVNSARYLKGESRQAPSKMHEDLAPFRNWDEVIREAEKGDDPKIAMLQRLIDQYGTRELGDLVDQLVETNAKGEVPADGGLPGVEFVDMPHGRIATGDTFPVKGTLKDAGFRYMEVPGKTTPKGAPLKAWTAVGTPEQRQALVDSVQGGPSRQPDVIVSTAHKAKGLEWDRVRIGDDFKGPKVDAETDQVLEMPDPEELRLAYVAVTRAQQELDPGSLAYVFAHTDENGGTPGTRTPDAPELPGMGDVTSFDDPRVTQDPVEQEILRRAAARLDALPTDDVPDVPQGTDIPDTPEVPEARSIPDTPIGGAGQWSHRRDGDQFTVHDQQGRQAASYPISDSYPEDLAERTARNHAQRMQHRADGVQRDGGEQVRIDDLAVGDTVQHGRRERTVTSIAETAHPNGDPAHAITFDDSDLPPMVHDRSTYFERVARDATPRPTMRERDAADQARRAEREAARTPRSGRRGNRGAQPAADRPAGAAPARARPAPRPAGPGQAVQRGAGRQAGVRGRPGRDRPAHRRDQPAGRAARRRPARPRRPRRPRHHRRHPDPRPGHRHGRQPLRACRGGRPQRRPDPPGRRRAPPRHHGPHPGGEHPPRRPDPRAPPRQGWRGPRPDGDALRHRHQARPGLRRAPDRVAHRARRHPRGARGADPGQPEGRDRAAVRVAL